MFIENFDLYLRHEWTKMLVKTLPSIFDAVDVESRVFDCIRRILRLVHPNDMNLKDGVEDKSLFEKLRSIVTKACELVTSMRLEPFRYVSTFPVRGDVSKGSNSERSSSIKVGMCLFPGIFKQNLFLKPTRSSNISIFAPKIVSESTMKQWNL